MSHATLDDVARIRAEAAAEERTAILEMIEHAMRLLAHRRGADATLILQQLIEEVRARA